MAFTHLDEKGNSRMVSVVDKSPSKRVAKACGIIKLTPEIMRLLLDKKIPKGDVLSVARIAGIMGVKKTFELIPMCHQIPIEGCTIDFEIIEDRCEIKAFCRVENFCKTGVEMEALTGVNISLLTIYDMCKGVDKGMVIKDVFLISKTGGKSGSYLKGSE